MRTVLFGIRLEWHGVLRISEEMAPNDGLAFSVLCTINLRLNLNTCKEGSEGD